MSIDALVFDKDGTLFDFAATWGAFGKAVLLRLSEGDNARASLLGKSIGAWHPQQDLASIVETRALWHLAPQKIHEHIWACGHIQ